MIDTILTDVEKLELQKFADNAILFEAVKKVVLFDVYFNGTLKAGEAADPLRNYSLGFVAPGYDERGAKKPELSNEQIGEKLRASWEGVNCVEAGFKALKGYKTPLAEKSAEEIKKEKNAKSGR